MKPGTPDLVRVLTNGARGPSAARPFPFSVASPSFECSGSGDFGELDKVAPC